MFALAEKCQAELALAEFHVLNLQGSICVVLSSHWPKYATLDLPLPIHADSYSL